MKKLLLTLALIISGYFISSANDVYWSEDNNDKTYNVYVENVNFNTISYSSRINRFHRNYVVFGYYNPYFMNPYHWYSDFWFVYSHNPHLAFFYYSILYYMSSTMWSPHYGYAYYNPYFMWRWGYRHHRYWHYHHNYHHWYTYNAFAYGSLNTGYGQNDVWQPRRSTATTIGNNGEGRPRNFETRSVESYQENARTVEQYHRPDKSIRSQQENENRVRPRSYSAPDNTRLRNASEYRRTRPSSIQRDKTTTQPRVEPRRAPQRSSGTSRPSVTQPNNRRSTGGSNISPNRTPSRQPTTRPAPSRSPSSAPSRSSGGGSSSSSRRR